MAAEAYLEGEAEVLSRRAVELALGGDTTALRLCLERTVPPCRDRRVTFSMPPIKTAGDALTATNAMLVAVSTGELTPAEAAELGKFIDGCVRTLEMSEFEDRLQRLEAAAGQ